MKTQKATLRTHLWFEAKDEVLFGMGRYLLLKKVSELGSLNKASKALNMSYRAAWGKIKTTENAIGALLLDREPGKKGFMLTPLGRELLDKFEGWVESVEKYALQEAEDLFPWKLNDFESVNKNNES